MEINIEQLYNQVQKNTEAIKELQKKTNQNMNKSQQALSDSKRNTEALMTAAQSHGALREELVSILVKNQKTNNDMIAACENAVIKLEAKFNWFALPWYKRMFKKIP